MALSTLLQKCPGLERAENERSQAISNGEEFVKREPMNKSPASIAARYGTTRHSFRRSLPTHVLRELPRQEPEVVAAMRRAEERLRELEVRSEPVNLKRITMQDLRDFLIAYCACFMAVMAFIA